ncbi:LysR family transcriptional regulator [Phenylobacterium deserti]|uniref:LysR family transcriptional regulator n=1 Tax=Phenylobacterium deserti TaxID=1914756 RepID=A0A328AQW2_9CAUL|nr:LysR family transcriptional regulator [Phenylobacterium deserti]RAK57413.1 LysR family transcriptional regulator [Phenylobacterium deserti]
MLNQIDLSRTDLNLLVLFEAVMRERHVGRAAGALNLTASAVSHGLRRLRLLLGDPLFLKTPRGVVPTQRAEELAPGIAEALARVRSVVASREPFDPARSTRRFRIGAPDAVSSVLLPPLLAELARQAPGVDIGLRQLLPKAGETTMALGWRDSLLALEAREMDVAILPFHEVPARFISLDLFSEDFVVAARVGHPYLRRPDLEHYCRQQHLVVSQGGDPRGFVDDLLERQGLARRVALTAPNFMSALAVLADTDLISALPRRFVDMHGARYGVASVAAPFAFPTYAVSLIVPRVAMMDAGVSWLASMLSTLVPKGAEGDGERL